MTTKTKIGPVAAADDVPTTTTMVNGYQLPVSVIILAITLVTGCGKKESQSLTQDVNDWPVVAVTNYPLKFFTERMAGQYVSVAYPVESDGWQGDPSAWKPSSVAVTIMQKADRVLTNGAGYENWLQMVSLSESSIVDTSRSYADRLIDLEDTVVHQHGPEGERSDKKKAFFTWLNPELAVAQARAVADELVKLAPDGKDDIETAFQILERELRAVRQELLATSPAVSEANLIAATPVFHYLGQAASSTFRNVEWSTDKEPTPEQWATLDQMLKQKPAKAMLWPCEPSQAIRDGLAERGLKVIVFEPMGKMPAKGDFISGMRENIQRLAAGVTD